MGLKPNERNGQWVVLILTALTGMMTVAAPTMCLPVLFDEIASELGLSLVQVGLVWGLGALAGMITGLVSGPICDWLGARHTLTLGCLLVGPAGALRGLATNLVTFAAAVFLYSLVTPLIMMSLTKACGALFPRRKLGLANGILTMGVALGFMVSSLISATLLSPWLGGWRNVLFFYSAIALVFSLLWGLTRSLPTDAEAPVEPRDISSLRLNTARVARIRKVWLLGLVLMGFAGCVEGTLGYLPLYLRGLGWSGAAADGAVSLFHAASMIAVLPIALWSDRLGTRKKVLMVATLTAATGVGLLSVVEGLLVWGAVAIAGSVRDGFMAVFMSGVMETQGVGVAYAGTAMGLITVLSGLGRLAAPPLGNSLATTAPSLPFVFWASLALLGLLGLHLVREEKAPALA